MMPRNLLEIFHENKELESGALVGSTLIKKMKYMALFLTMMPTQIQILISH